MKNISFLLLAVFFWALNFYLGKEAMQYVSPNVTGFWRFVFGALAIWMIHSFRVPSWSHLRKHLKGILLVGLVGQFGFIFFFFQGLNLTSAINGSLIISLNPAITLLLTTLFQGYKPNKLQIIGVVLSFLMFAIQNIWISIYSKRMDNLEFTTLTSFACLLGFSALMLIEPAAIPVSELPASFWWAEIGMGVFGTAVAYYCWNYGIKKVGPAKGSIFINLLPIFTAMMAIFLGQELYSYHFISLVITLCGLLLVQRG